MYEYVVGACIEYSKVMLYQDMYRCTRTYRDGITLTVFFLNEHFDYYIKNPLILMYRWLT